MAAILGVNMSNMRTIKNGKQIEKNKPLTKLIRPSWDEYFFRIVNEVSTRSTCLRRQVGALIVREKRIQATGYNGAPSGIDHCSKTGCLREEKDVPSGERHELCRGLHAEQNAIIQASRHGINISNAMIYCTHHPCVLCAKMLINAGIEAIYFQQGYPDKLSKDLLDKARVRTIKIDGADNV